VTERTAARLAWVVLGGIVLVSVASVAVSLGTGSGLDPFAVAVLSFPIVGALIASHQPRNAIGWIMLAVGAASALDGVLVAYSDFGLTIDKGSVPRPDIALALASPIWVPIIGLPGTFLILLFPDGRLPSPAWRRWAWLCAIALILSFIGILVGPGSFADAGYPDIRNPLGIEALRPVFGVVFAVILLIPISIVGCAVSLIGRFRRSRGQERLQLKWLASGAGVTAAIYLTSMVPSLALNSRWDESGPVWLIALQTMALFALALLPVEVGIAILKYRLYDIDFIINRTLVYGVLTAALSAAYFLAVTVLQAILRPVAGRSQLAVAGSTLAVAALFRPGRARIQAFIDRRFYRRKYDAAQTLETFSSRLREEVDSTR
jgi:hypothetical protein